MTAIEIEELCSWLKEHIAYGKQMMEGYKKYTTLPEKGWYEHYAGCVHTAEIVLKHLSHPSEKETE